ncbi:MAG: universal stress protein [Deltaproteobacteria bacterium]|nr:universal stress protein [Deltaproteobacteria bacterium]
MDGLAIKPSKPNNRRMLVCLDGSPHSELSMPYAVSLAAAFGCTITLVHVLDPHRSHSGPQSSDVLAWEISRQTAQTYLDRVHAELERSLGTQVDRRLDQGRPADRIVDVAREISADFTVVGCGLRAETTRVLGSTAQQVLALGRSSVLVVHPSPGSPTLATPRRLLVPLDGSVRAESVLPTASRIAKMHDAEVVLVHVVQEAVSSTLIQRAGCFLLVQQLAEILHGAATQYLDELKQQLQHDVRVVRTLVARHPNPRQRLLELAASEKTDLIVLSAHGTTCDSGQPFGCVAAHIIAHSTVATLVIQDLPQRSSTPPPKHDSMLSSPTLRASFAAESR